MTIEETNKILELLDKNDLNKLRDYIQNKKIKYFNKSRQLAFENYLSASQIADKTILYDDRNQGRIIFSNGISVYYLNYNYVNLNSPTLIHNSFCERVDLEEVKKIQFQLDRVHTKLVPVTYVTEGDRLTQVEGIGNLQTPSFSSAEIKFADAILDNPFYKVDSKYPLLAAESEVGKAYILGYTNKSNR